MSKPNVRLLGFAPLANLDHLRAALHDVSGPSVSVISGPAAAAVFQAEPGPSLFGGGRKAMATGLLTVQRRLEVACQAGPFLPMDPSAACCPAESLPGILDRAWDALAAAVAAHGAQHQWDVVLRWPAERVLVRRKAEIAAMAPLGQAALAEAVGAALLAERSRREATLLTALAPAVRAFAAGGAACTETEIAVTVLVASGQEAPVEAALDGLPEDDVDGASIDMRGPLPPLSFAAVRLGTVEADEIGDAWHLLNLPGGIDLATLHRQWRMLAASVHPDRHPVADSVTVPALTRAYRLLRPLLLIETDRKFQTLNGLLRHAGPRLIVPEEPAPAPSPRPVLEMAQ